MLHRHYAPRGQATLVWPSAQAQKTLAQLYDMAQSIGLRPVILCAKAMHEAMGARACLVLDEQGDMAHGLFAALRQADEWGFDRVFIQGVDPAGPGLAYMNRALRAAGFDVAGET